MTPICDLLTALVAGLPDPIGSEEAGVRVSLTDVDLTLPIESRIDRGGVLHAGLPRGTLATGFDPPLGRLSARFVCVDAERRSPDDPVEPRAARGAEVE